MPFVFNDLFILDLANNHFGDVNHAKNIINKFGKLIRAKKIKASIKFQFRNLDTFIHTEYKTSKQKYITRFLSTKLGVREFYELFALIKKNSLLTSCTPFDEESISLIEKMKFNILKIASASSLDFNLLERATYNSIPKIISTGGKTLSDIDKIVSFLKKKKQNFALMHCVAIYPSKREDLQIGFIQELKRRYPDITIGWSTHENSDEMMSAPLAYACGARIFEKHIGIKTPQYPLNKYSVTPDNFDSWFSYLACSKKMLGNKNKTIKKEELITLLSLSRGVYAKKRLKKNQVLKKEDYFFSIPLQKGQLSSADIKDGTINIKNIKENMPILEKNVKYNKDLISEYKIRSYVHEVKAILNYNKIQLKENFDMEISHHKGISNFRKTGCFLFNIINKDYAKKMLVLLPNQRHPLHFHKKKEETFHIIAGTLVSRLNGKKRILYPGDILDIKKNSWHDFQAGEEGCIFDEISTTSFKDDSFYKDNKIKKLSRDQRKTYINNWY